MAARRLTMLTLLFVTLVPLLCGCGPTPEQIALGKALSARVDRAPTYNESAKFLKSYVDKRDKDCVMWSMDYASLCIMGGNYDVARQELLSCYGDIEQRQDKTAEQIAAMSAEQAKLFKGEPFERAMLCTYLGLMNYMDGQYNNARICFAQAHHQDKTTLENMKEYRNDFRLAHYWLGRSYMKLGEMDNATIAFSSAGARVPRKNEQQELESMRRRQKRWREQWSGLEKQAYENATKCEMPVEGCVDLSATCNLGGMPECLPGSVAETRPSPVVKCAQTQDEFLSVDYQNEANLILVIEAGTAPVKMVSGMYGSGDQILRAGYQERQVVVYLNGRKAGPGFQLLDMFHQADTRGSGKKDALQVTKGVLKFIAKQLPYISYAANFWDVSADTRYWHLLPGEVHVFAAKVKPGLYTVNVQSADCIGVHLPRYSLTRHFIPVRQGQENVYVLHTKPEADNDYVPPVAN